LFKGLELMVAAFKFGKRKILLKFVTREVALGAPIWQKPRRNQRSPALGALTVRPDRPAAVAQW
jgi:hypothetical protein